MNRTKKIVLLLLLAASLMMTGCNTPPKEKDPEFFIANVNGFRYDYLRCLLADTLNRPAVNDLVLYLYPKSNTLEVRWKNGGFLTCYDWSQKDRELITSCAETYLEAYNSGNLPVQKPKKKTAWWSGKLSVGWGLGDFTRAVDAKSYITYEYLEEGKPYFLIHSDPTETTNEEHVSSPKISIYLSPTQLQSLVDMMKQENLVASVNEIVEEAYEW